MNLIILCGLFANDLDKILRGEELEKFRIEGVLWRLVTHRRDFRRRGKKLAVLDQKGFAAKLVDELQMLGDEQVIDALVTATPHEVLVINDAYVTEPSVSSHTIRCDYCGDVLPRVKDRAHIPTTPDLQRLGFDADKIVCPDCARKARDADPRSWQVSCPQCEWSASGNGGMGGTNTLTRHRIHAHPRQSTESTESAHTDKSK